MAKYFAVVVAAGISARFGGDKPKQYFLLHNKTVLEHSIESLLAYDGIEKLILALNSEDQYWPTLSLSHHPKIQTTIGGKTRAQSVINALKDLQNIANAEDWILVHDGARPFLPKQDLLNLVNTTKDHEIGGILAAPVVDTLKFSQDGKHIEKTVERTGLYRALTPQCFRYGKLLAALEATVEQTITDEAMAIELAGHQALLVPGDPANIKITYLEDLAKLQTLAMLTSHCQSN